MKFLPYYVAIVALSVCLVAVQAKPTSEVEVSQDDERIPRKFFGDKFGGSKTQKKQKIIVVVDANDSDEWVTPRPRPSNNSNKRWPVTWTKPTTNTNSGTPIKVLRPIYVQAPTRRRPIRRRPTYTRDSSEEEDYYNYPTAYYQFHNNKPSKYYPVSWGGIKGSQWEDSNSGSHEYQWDQQNAGRSDLVEDKNEAAEEVEEKEEEEPIKYNVKEQEKDEQEADEEEAPEEQTRGLLGESRKGYSATEDDEDDDESRILVLSPSDFEAESRSGFNKFGRLGSQYSRYIERLLRKKYRVFRRKLHQFY